MNQLHFIQETLEVNFGWKAHSVESFDLEEPSEEHFELEVPFMEHSA